MTGTVGELDGQTVLLQSLTYDPTHKGSPRWNGEALAMDGQSKVRLWLWIEDVQFLNREFEMNIQTKQETYTTGRMIVLSHHNSTIRMAGADVYGDYKSVREANQ